MTTDGSWALQQAVYTALTGDAELIALLGPAPRIYDKVPEDVIFPYLTIGEAGVKPYPGYEGASEHDLRFHVWSRYAGHREVKTIMTAVYHVLHNQTFPVFGYELVSMRYIFGDIFRKADMDTFHAVLRYRAVLEATGGA